MGGGMTKGGAHFVPGGGTHFFQIRCLPYTQRLPIVFLCVSGNIVSSDMTSKMHNGASWQEPWVTKH